MKNNVNIAVQVLPQSKVKGLYDLVDDAIAVIQKSGLKYQVCPFETTIEGPYDEIMKVIKEMQIACFDNGADELIVNIKIQNRKDGNVSIEEKMEKYTK